jgi:hypothetical protein
VITQVLPPFPLAPGKGLGAGVVAFLLLLTACAPTRYPLGLALRQGRLPPVSVPDSLRVDLEILPLATPGAFPVSARLYAQPHRRYRLEVFGFASVIAASYLWQEGHWILLLHQKHAAFYGQGDSLIIEGQEIRIPDVHALLGFLWGEPLPNFLDRDGEALDWRGDTLRWSAHGIAWWARFDPASGACLEAHSPSLGLKYGALRSFSKRALPEEVRVVKDGHAMLALRVRQVEDFPAWKMNPFVLKVPSGYMRHDQEAPDVGQESQPSQ